MTDPIDEQIRRLVAEMVDAAPVAVEAPLAVERPAARSGRRLVGALLLVLVAALGAWFLTIERDGAVSVGDDADSEPDLRSELPLILQRERTPRDALPADAPERIGSGRSGPELDVERSRRGASIDGYTLWVIPAVDNSEVCVVLQTAADGPSWTTGCGRVNSAYVGSVSLGSFTSETTVLAGLLLHPDVVGVIGGTVVDGTYLVVDEGADLSEQSDPEEPLEEAVFVFRDGSTGTRSNVLAAVAAVCDTLWRQFLGASNVVDPIALVALPAVADNSRLAPLIRATGRLASIAWDPDASMSVSSNHWRPAVGPAGPTCADAGALGWDAAVVGGAPGPAAEVDISEFGFEYRLGNLPLSGGIEGPTMVIAREETGCLTLRSSGEEIGCGPGVHTLPINDQKFGAAATLVVVDLPPETSFVTFASESRSEVVQLPRGNISVFINVSDETPMITAYDQFGAEVEIA